MKKTTPYDVRITRRGNLYAQVIDLRNHGYSYNAIHSILGECSPQYISAICRTYQAVENDDFSVFETNKRISDYRYILPWCIRALGKDENKIISKVEELCDYRKPERKKTGRGIAAKITARKDAEIPKAVDDIRISPELITSLNDNLSFFRNLICGKMLAAS
jgi:hypothetical protein